MLSLIGIKGIMRVAAQGQDFELPDVASLLNSCFFH